MQKEVVSLEANETWTAEALPPWKHAIDSKWDYKTKYKLTREVERYKAHLVARRFTQIEGIDFHETFAPVAKLVTIHNTLLLGDLIEDLYMKIP